jgi:hypothetical protein
MITHEGFNKFYDALQDPSRSIANHMAKILADEIDKELTKVMEPIIDSAQTLPRIKIVAGSKVVVNLVPDAPLGSDNSFVVDRTLAESGISEFHVLVRDWILPEGVEVKPVPALSMIQYTLYKFPTPINGRYESVLVRDNDVAYHL